MMGAYAVAVFVCAFLLFLIQPMFGKMVLPLLGGAPAVWNTCLLFFQGMLLAGYLYAHLSTRFLSVRHQAVAHCAFLAAVALLLPITVRGSGPPDVGTPIPWLIALMLGTVGLPFFVLSATGPMLQRWFADGGHPENANPYPLYAASNLGSMLSLLAYPVLMEPRLRLVEQSVAWSWGYLLLGLLLAGCAALSWMSPASTAYAVERDEHAPLSSRRRALWVLLAFVPSSLLLGATTYITTDLTPAPLLWTLPLALYLLSFTLTFARRPPIRHEWMVAIQPAVLCVVALMLVQDSMPRPVVALPVHLTGLFVTAMVCHGELVRTRPAARHLTDFYLWISVGGVLGGIFNVLVAPVVFTSTWEYPLVLVLACLTRPWPSAAASVHSRTALRAMALAAGLLLLTNEEVARLPLPIIILMGAVAVYLLGSSLARTPGWLAFCIGALLAVRLAGIGNERAEVLYASRSFYGHYTVVRAPVGTGYHVLTHGSTLHGAQGLHPERRREPLTYYVRRGPLGDIFASRGISTRPRRVAVVGLGAGATAAYAVRGEEWTFYELDPGMERVARDPRLFTYLSDSPASIRVVLGDARTSLAREGEGIYDLIVLDAFSSDAIPVHLLTREALDTYLRRLAPDGQIAVHISNRYLDLEPVVARLARQRGLFTMVGRGPEGKRDAYESISTWMLLARSQASLATLRTSRAWADVRPHPDAPEWTDDFSSLVSVFRW